MKIGQTPAVSLNHDAAKVELLRAGNELDLLVKRYSEIQVYVVFFYMPSSGYLAYTWCRIGIAIKHPTGRNWNCMV